MKKIISKKTVQSKLPDIVEIDARGVVFFCQVDEAAFFGQLDKISCVLDYTPVSFRVSKKKLNQHNLRELLACCYRYKLDMTQLRIFDRKEYADWLRDKNKYWYKSVFGPPGIKPPEKLRRLLKGKIAAI